MGKRAWPRSFPDINWDFFASLCDDGLTGFQSFAMCVVYVEMDTNVLPAGGRGATLFWLARQVNSEEEAIGFLRYLGYDSAELSTGQDLETHR